MIPKVPSGLQFPESVTGKWSGPAGVGPGHLHAFHRGAGTRERAWGWQGVHRDEPKSWAPRPVHACLSRHLLSWPADLEGPNMAGGEVQLEATLLGSRASTTVISTSSLGQVPSPFPDIPGPCLGETLTDTVWRASPVAPSVREARQPGAIPSTEWPGGPVCPLLLLEGAPGGACRCMLGTAWPGMGRIPPSLFDSVQVLQGG